MSNVYTFQKKMQAQKVNLIADGIQGAHTTKILKGFQYAFGLKNDGIIGTKTLAKINGIPNGAVRSWDTLHFKQSEFTCHHCGKNPGIYLGLLIYLETIKLNHGGKPVFIMSGYRCYTHNKNVGGARYSYHRYCKAADIKVSGLRPSYSVVEPIMKNNGVGKYSTFIHVDIRNHKARWSG